MLHLALLLFGLIVWIGIIYLDGLEEADAMYLLFAPELKDRRNGIKWLRSNPRHLSFRRISKLFLCYLLIEDVKCAYLIFIPFDYRGWQLAIMILSMIFIPLAIFPYFHDIAYYHRYTQLANKPTPDAERTVYDIDLPKVRIIRMGGKEAVSMLVFGIGLLVGEILILFAF